MKRVVMLNLKMGISRKIRHSAITRDARSAANKIVSSRNSIINGAFYFLYFGVDDSFDFIVGNDRNVDYIFASLLF